MSTYILIPKESYGSVLVHSDSLYHHGILGQKWGIRRYQNPDGSLTPEGKARYGTAENFNRVRKAIKTGTIVAGPVGGAIAGAIANKKTGVGGSASKKHKTSLATKMAINAAMRKKAKEKKSPEYQEKKRQQEEANKKFRQMNTKQKVDYAKKSGNFDMEFLEQNGDIDERTGNSLKGDKLYKAYEKWLKDRE